MTRTEGVNIILFTVNVTVDFEAASQLLYYWSDTTIIKPAGRSHGPGSLGWVFSIPREYLA